MCYLGESAVAYQQQAKTIHFLDSMCYFIYSTIAIILIIFYIYKHTLLLLYVYHHQSKILKLVNIYKKDKSNLLSFNANR